MRNAIHRLKYRWDLGLGEALSKHSFGFRNGLGWHFDLMVPILLSRQRNKERGYNQIALVARPLALQLGNKYLPQGLIRRKHTLSQVGLSAQERRDNVEGAFWANPKLVSNKSILIMDDVATTGSTLDSASQALFEAGVTTGYAFTLTRAMAHHSLNVI